MSPKLTQTTVAEVVNANLDQHRSLLMDVKKGIGTFKPAHVQVAIGVTGSRSSSHVAGIVFSSTHMQFAQTEKCKHIGSSWHAEQ